MTKKSKKPLEHVTGPYCAVPHAVLDSQAFKGATDRAKSLLYALMRQHNGGNNGRLQLTDKWLAAHGWTSKGNNATARNELLERGLIVQTRRGGLNSGCNWFALTWLPITNYSGLEISANSYHQGAWHDCKLQPTARRKPPENARRPPATGAALPRLSGQQKAAEGFAAPTTGAKEAIFNPFTTPTSGNNVLLPPTPQKHAGNSKRIVGKAGRSGIPKSQQSGSAP